MYYPNHVNFLKLPFDRFLRSLPNIVQGSVFCNVETKQVAMIPPGVDTPPEVMEWGRHPDMARFQYHALPQVHHFFDNNSQSVLDYVIRFENLQEDFSVLMESLGQKPAAIPIFNYSGNKNGKHDHYSRSTDIHYTEFYTEQWMIDLVGEIYKLDVDFGNYSFDTQL